MTIKFRLLIAACCVAPVLLPASSLSAPAQGSASVPPDVRQALGRMAAALRSLNSFELRADTTSEEVLENGQKLQSASVITADVRRPNRLYIDVDSERRKRRFYYDGKTLTIFGPVGGYYAAAPAPPTTYNMLRLLSERYGVETPLADLFEWGADAVKIERIKSAVYAGPDRIAGELCDHYAMRQTGVDWQVWIRREGPALPCKMVIVNTGDAAQPQTTVQFTWTTARQFADARFQFTPPAGSRRIMLRAAPGTTGEIRR